MATFNNLDNSFYWNLLLMKRGGDIIEVRNIFWSTRSIIYIAQLSHHRLFSGNKSNNIPIHKCLYNDA